MRISALNSVFSTSRGQSIKAIFALLVIFGIPVVLIVLFVGYVIRSNKERQKIRLELGKLADELEQMRKQRESDARNNS